MRTGWNSISVLFVATIFAISSVTKSIQQIEEGPREGIGYRLPTNIIPSKYVIKITPYFESRNFTFDGSVEITANVVENTTKIVLHIDGIDGSMVVRADGRPYHIASVFHDNKNHFLTMTFRESFTVGQTIIIESNYRGKLSTTGEGFYRDSYVDYFGTRRWLAATWLSPTFARKMFPCFDEPAFKATFVLTVNRPANYNALSNTPLKTSEFVGNERVEDTFEETPVMSTYLLALVVSDFVALSDDENNCSFWARPNAIEQGKFALSMIPILSKSYEKVLGHPYQLKKLGMVALPTALAESTENWGLIIFKESAIIYDPKMTSIRTKQQTALDIAHGIANQWFGNQVTPRWWQYLWLSEGFGEYLSYRITSEVEPQWGLESQFIVDQLYPAFKADSNSLITHPMSRDVYIPNEIWKSFDVITYAKSASIVRMMEKTFGTKLFYVALHDYLEARKYNDATPDHLFEAFQRQIDLSGTKLEASVKTIMDTWTTQSGYPVLDVILKGSLAFLIQRRLYLEHWKEKSNGDIWWIPVTWASKSNPDFSKTSPNHWMNQRRGIINVNVENEWVIFNVQQSGYYRVNYDPASWKRIIEVLKSDNFTIIHEINRAALINDLLTLARNGQVDYKTALSATQYLSTETNYIPWRAAMDGLEHLNEKLRGQDHFELYKKHIVTILSPVYEKLGFYERSPESHYDKLLRIFTVEWACQFDVESCITWSLKHFAAWKSNSTLLPVGMEKTIYCSAIKYGSMDDWEFLWKHFLTSTLDEKRVIMRTLACSNRPEAYEKLFSNMINWGVTHDTGIEFLKIIWKSGSIGFERTLNFLNRNFTDLPEYYRQSFIFRKLVYNLSLAVNNGELFRKFKDFFEAQSEKFPRLRQPSIHYTNLFERNFDELDKRGANIIEWLNEAYSGNDDHDMDPPPVTIRGRV